MPSYGTGYDDNEMFWIKYYFTPVLFIIQHDLKTLNSYYHSVRNVLLNATKVCVASAFSPKNFNGPSICFGFI
jgi:hypothetical protein